ncbi:uncharacterized protein EV420DRAFT_1080408 [Desarmillaria tabescens]|uniref:Uncharacterized protein n=1 Tax=Armillaria tabescens TaxID=1929756 RepID=A0AA39JH20_ARMTA|nr:uncharacterized protein EV420DRAFT_1080408 [Desarmillaria tabescens]KAK0442289.1 hypothetical protein EV420DRAFT_1080408 [Desarmillaria tabescens]
MKDTDGNAAGKATVKELDNKEVQVAVTTNAPVSSHCSANPWKDAISEVRLLLFVCSESLIGLKYVQMFLFFIIIACCWKQYVPIFCIQGQRCILIWTIDTKKLLGRWRSWLSHLSNTQKVLSSSLGQLTFYPHYQDSATNDKNQFKKCIQSMS